eukprot:365704-Chlamydomonas_euryale.AAC.3
MVGCVVVGGVCGCLTVVRAYDVAWHEDMRGVQVGSLHMKNGEAGGHCGRGVKWCIVSLRQWRSLPGHCAGARCACLYGFGGERGCSGHAGGGVGVVISAALAELDWRCGAAACCEGGARRNAQPAYGPRGCIKVHFGCAHPARGCTSSPVVK